MLLKPLVFTWFGACLRLRNIFLQDRNIQDFEPLFHNFGTQKPPKMLPKSTSKNTSKFTLVFFFTKNDSLLASQNHPKWLPNSIQNHLGPPEADLGPILNQLDPFGCPFYDFSMILFGISGILPDFHEFSMIFQDFEHFSQHIFLD